MRAYSDTWRIAARPRELNLEPMATRTQISATELLNGRIEELRSWLDTNAPHCRLEQKHLDEGTAERAYWHYGYLSALQDVLRIVFPEDDQPKM